MAINSHMLRWFEQLQNSHKIFSESNLAELGPQDFYGGGGKKSAKNLFPSTWTGRDLYLKYGCKTYTSFDLLDERSIRVDFNSPPSASKQFEVVTNFGTSEHVFNQSAFMKFMHESTTPDGFMLHVVPSAGARNHGFFNYHPTFFFDLARANNYSLISFDYIPHNALQAARPDDARIVNLLAHRDAPRTRDEPLVRKAILSLMLRSDFLRLNVRLALRTVRRRNFSSFFETYGSGDYLQVALRKNGDSPFTMPIQGMYS
jgi:hypothetical protein